MLFSVGAGVSFPAVIGLAMSQATFGRIAVAVHDDRLALEWFGSIGPSGCSVSAPESADPNP